jgi:hypothetical protein
MAYGKASKQTYFGRVIFPAERKSANNKNFLSFYIFVDNLAREKGDDGSWKQTSGRIQCSYTPRGNNPEVDPVVAILTRVSSQKSPNQLAGLQYSSVEVLVEGTEKLVAVADKNGAYYKSLEYVDVTITDNQIIAAFRTFKEGVTGQGQGQQTQQQPVQQAQQPAQTFAPAQQPAQQQFAPAQAAPPAPQPAPQQPVQQAQPAQQTPATYEKGAVVNIGSVPHQFVGTDPSNPAHWVAGRIDGNGQFVANTNNVAEGSVVNATTSTTTAPQQPAQQTPPAPGNGLTSVKDALQGNSYAEAPPNTGLPSAQLGNPPV